MALHLIMQRLANGDLGPIHGRGRDELVRLKRRYVHVTVTQPKNLKLLAKYYVFVDLIFENQLRYTTKEDVDHFFRFATGHFTEHRMPGGAVTRVPASIADMDGPTFDAYYDSVCRLARDQLIPGLEQSDIDREVLEQIAGFVG